MKLNRVATREEWVTERLDLLEAEKEATRARDEVAQRRANLPFVPVPTEYQFISPSGDAVALKDLFESREQLIVRHFMFHADWNEGCIGCSMQADSVGHLAHLNARNTTFVMTSRAPQKKLQAFRIRMGWDIPWYSTVGNTFNEDFNVMVNGSDIPGVSVFVQRDGQIYYTYSVFDRGGDIFKNYYNYLDLTPLGRQEEELENPWDWWRHHDKYDTEGASTPGNNFWNKTDKFTK